MTTLKKGFLYLTLFLIIPLGIISKILNISHELINDLIVRYKAYLDNTTTKKWKTVVAFESKQGTWELVNAMDRTDGRMSLLYFNKDENTPLFDILVTDDELEELLEFAKTLDTNVYINK